MDTDRTQPHLPIHVGTELLVEVLDLNLRLKCSLLGFQDEKFLIIGLSAKDLSGIYSKDTVTSSPIVVRYMNNGTVYGFETKVLNMIQQPTRLAFLAYPDKIEEHNVRAKPRYECILPASALFGDNAFEAILADISEGGCRAVIKIPEDGNKKDQLNAFADVDGKVDLQLKLPGLKDGLPVSGTVRSVNKDVDRVVLGICFKGSAEEVRNKLSDFVALVSLIK